MMTLAALAAPITANIVTIAHPSQRDTYARMMVDMVAGTVIRAGGDFPLSSLRSELHRAVDIMLDGVRSHS